MRIYENFTSDNYIDDDIPAVCIGGFDGVHLGHQELLKYTKESSNLFQIVTFDTLPKKYFNNEHMLLQLIMRRLNYSKNLNLVI